jgi:ectoine hydroxylase-related dioxygenase (phytanoyl-CoA dioxygenase family)
VLAGSHRLGRIDHFRMGGQAGADPERVELARLGLGLAHLHVLMEPGDALFFHCNLLHTSDQNTSDLRRWAMISSYNQVALKCFFNANVPCQVRNAPEGPQPTGPFRPLVQVANSAVRECERMESTVDKEFMDPDTDK